MKFLPITGILLLMMQCIHIPRTTEYNPDLEYLDINGYRFHSKTTGNKNGPPVIVIHGGPGGDFNYLLNLEQLAGEFNLLFYDQRLTGLSPRKSPVSGGIEQDIADLHSIVQKFAGSRKVILIGHSYGGMIATGFLSRFPDMVEKAVIIEPGILDRESAFEFVSSLKKQSSIFSFINIIPLLFKSILVRNEDGNERTDYVMTKMQGNGTGKPYQCEGTALPENSFIRSGFSIVNKTIRPMISDPGLFNTDLVSGLHKFPGPILLLSSSCSFIGYDYQETYHMKFFPGQTRHVLLSQTGHNYISTDPEKGIPVIREFIKTGKIKTGDSSLTVDLQQRLKQTLLAEINREKTPGVQYTIIGSDRTLFQFSAGMADLSRQKPVTELTTFHAFSITKVFTSLAILQLADQGKLQLDDKIAAFLPDNPYDKTITIKQLLNHTSGIPNPLPLKWVHPVTEEFDYKTFIHSVIRENPAMKARPGEKMNYSNLEYLLLGEIIEQASGMEYREYVRTNILDRLDIPREELDFTLDDSLHAEGYIKKYSILNFVFGFLIDKKKMMDGAANGWVKFRKFYLNGPAYGGLIGTGPGLAGFLQALLQKNDLISDKSRNLIFSRSALGNGEKIDMSLGWFYGELNGIPYYTHAGGGGGYYAEVRVYPTRKLATVVMFNRTGISDERFLDQTDKIFLNSL